MASKAVQMIKTLATIEANTANHKEDLKEFKRTFDKHIEREERAANATNSKIDSIQECLSDFECPDHGNIKKMERRFYDSQKVNEGRRITDLEERAKEKAIEVKERAKKDEEVAKEISSLKTSRKYQWLTSSGIYIILGVILKKIFTS